MNRFITTGLLLTIAVSVSFAGAIRQVSNKIHFKGIGTYQIQSTFKTQNNIQLHDSQKDFKGSGFTGNMLAKFVLKPGHTARVINLDKSQVIDINHNRKAFRIKPLRKQSVNPLTDGDDEESGMNQDTESSNESDIKIIRNEFDVKKTGNSKTINGFPCNEYLITWVVEWQNINTQKSGIDSLSSHVWTTAVTSEMKAAEAEERSFASQLSHTLDLGLDDQHSQMLGLHWLAMFQALNQQQDHTGAINEEEWTQKLKRIKGYPVLTDGKYFVYSKTPQNKVKEKEEKINYRSKRSIFSGIMKKAFSKKKKKVTQKTGIRKANFSFHTEMKMLKSASIPASAFQPPAGYRDNTPQR